MVVLVVVVGGFGGVFICLFLPRDNGAQVALSTMARRTRHRQTRTAELQLCGTDSRK